MNREHHRWYSPRLNRDMELLVFGHAGAPVLIFPTSQGRYYEYEDRGMVAGIGDFVEQGWLQLYCVDSVDAESFYARWAQPADRIRRHIQYEEYLLNEVLPLMRQKNDNHFIVTHGCSFGAYHAANIAFRHPHLFGRCVLLSGLFDMTMFFGSYYDDNVYHHTPSHYIHNLHDPQQIERIRGLDIIFAAGEHDPHIANSRALSQALWNKNIWHAFREWDGWSHDWPYWQAMARQYILGHD